VAAADSSGWRRGSSGRHGAGVVLRAARAAEVRRAGLCCNPGACSKPGRRVFADAYMHVLYVDVCVWSSSACFGYVWCCPAITLTRGAQPTAATAAGICCDSQRRPDVPSYCGVAAAAATRLFVPALLPCCGLTTAQLPHTTLFLIRQTSRDAANTAQGLAALLGWPPSLMSPAASPGVTGDAAECAGVQPGAAGPSSKQGVGGGGWLEALGANPDWRQVVGSITTALEVRLCVYVYVRGRGAGKHGGGGVLEGAVLAHGKGVGVSMCMHQLLVPCAACVSVQVALQVMPLDIHLQHCW
jgi:hypothetical protein